LIELNKLISETTSESISNDSGVSALKLSVFELNDSKNNKYNIPLYMQLIKNSNDENQLKKFGEAFDDSKEKFFASVNGLIEKYKGEYDESIISICNLLLRKKVNLSNYWESFKKNISEYTCNDVSSPYKKIRSLCIDSIKELLQSFPYEYCRDYDNEISKGLVKAFNTFMLEIGASTFALYQGDVLDYEAYDINAGSVACTTKDESMNDKIYSIVNFAYVFYEGNSNYSEQNICIIIKGNAFVYNVVN
jgi:hypothetical protein